MGYSAFTMDANTTKKVLRTKARDNHGHEYTAWIRFEEYCAGTFHNPATGKCDLKKRCDKWVFGCEAGGGWYLSDLLHGCATTLYIDFGQRWYIENFQELMAEAREML